MTARRISPFCRAALRFLAHPIALVLLLLVLAALPAPAMPPPRPGEMERMRASGELAECQAFARAIGNDRVHPGLILAQQARLQARVEGKPFRVETFPSMPPLQSKGSPRIVAILIEFPDYPHTIPAEEVAGRLFGPGKSEDAPYESMTRYHERSSYGQLHLQGNTLGWYCAKRKRDDYNSQTSVTALMKEALAFYEPTHDFTQYDNDGDGKIDYFCVFRTGPTTAWGTLWWGWCDNGARFANDRFTVDGKRLRGHCWLWETRDDNGFNPKTVIHETGHALGLPDYYDYDGSFGPKGGLGGWGDMMEYSGDHNCFSKWLLGWLEPTVISTTGTVQSCLLRPSATTKDCIVVMPGAASGNPYSEYFMVQYRSPDPTTLDNLFAGDGLEVWHVDGRPNSAGDNFACDNSYSPHKLLRLMEADGAEHIEQGKGFDIRDFYTPGSQIFSPGTFPDSRNYAGQNSGVCMGNLSRENGAMRADIGILVNDLAAATEGTDWFWWTGVKNGWIRQIEEAYRDGDAACNSPTADNTSSTMQTRIAGPCTVSFMWKASSQANADYLEFLLDGQLVNRISGVTGWQNQQAALTSGTHELSWRYRKNASGVAGQDCGWVDWVVVSDPALADAVDNPDLLFRNSTIYYNTERNLPWTRQTGSGMWQGDAAHVTVSRAAEDATFQTRVAGPGTVRFRWKSSLTYNGHDSVYFFIDNQPAAKIAMSWTTWQEISAEVSPGFHTLAWSCDRFLASDWMQPYQAWVDRLEFYPTLGKALDCTQAAWDTKGAQPWFSQSDTFSWNGDAARSGAVSHNQDRSLSVTLPCAFTVDFVWKASSEAGHDFLKFFHNDTIVDQISGETDWQRKHFLIRGNPPQPNTVVWQYAKDGAGSSGEDCGWLDHVEITTQTQLNHAVDNDRLVLQWEGASAWYGQFQTARYGEDAAQSGPTSKSLTSSLRTTLSGPGILKFYWKVSSQPEKDGLTLNVGSKQIKKISGETDWQQEVQEIGPGLQTVRWRYSKDSTITLGQDCGWVDQVEFQSTAPTAARMWSRY